MRLDDASSGDGHLFVPGGSLQTSSVQAITSGRNLTKV